MPTPYICCHDTAAAIEFYKKTFGAVETMRLAEPSGKIGHAQLEIGGSTIMLADEYPEFGVQSPRTLGGSPVRMHLYVGDVDAVMAKAAAAGAKVVREAADQFYGDRAGTFEDPCGHTWMVATHKEDVGVEEMQRRYDAMFE